MEGPWRTSSIRIVGGTNASCPSGLKASCSRINRFVFFVSTSLVFILVLLSCNPREKVPREFPDQKEMAHILADLYLAENIMSHGAEGLYNGSTNDKFPGYYKDVMDKYDLTTEKFDTIRKWYAAHPYLFQAVYDETIVILSQQEAEVKRQMAIEQEKDSIGIRDLWVGQRKYTTSTSDSTDQRFPFSLPLDSLQKGSLRMLAFYKLLKEDMTRQARMVLMMHYSDSTSDTVSYELPLSFQKKTASLSYTVDTAKTGMAVSGYLFDHDTIEVTSVEITDIRLEYFPGKKPIKKPEEYEDR